MANPLPLSRPVFRAANDPVVPPLQDEGDLVWNQLRQFDRRHRKSAFAEYLDDLRSHPAVLITGMWLGAMASVLFAFAWVAAR